MGRGFKVLGMGWVWTLELKIEFWKVGCRVACLMGQWGSRISSGFYFSVLGFKVLGMDWGFKLLGMGWGFKGFGKGLKPGTQNWFFKCGLQVSDLLGTFKCVGGVLLELWSLIRDEMAKLFGKSYLTSSMLLWITLLSMAMALFCPAQVGVHTSDFSS